MSDPKSETPAVWRRRLAQPVCLYQMGKVGSTSLRATLKDTLPADTELLYSHYLLESVPEEMRAWLRDDRWEPTWHASVERCLADMRRIGERVAAATSGLTVVTAVRDPLAVAVSSFFENIEAYGAALIWRPETTEADRIELALAFLQGQTAGWARGEAGGGLAGTVSRFLLDYPGSWFDRELHASLGVDVYAHPFPHDRGYQIISTARTDVLVLRYEDLARTVAPALHEFLGLTDIVLASLNRSDEKSSGPLARAIRSRLRVTPDVAARAYSTQYARHFYTLSERQRFARRWTGEDLRLAP